MDQHGRDDRDASDDRSSGLPELELWERFLAGETTSAEESRLRGETSQQGQGAPSPAAVRALVRAGLGDGAATPAVDAQAMLHALDVRLGLHARTARRRVLPAPSRLGWRRPLLAAAACAAVALVALVAHAPLGAPSIRSLRLGPEDTGTYRTDAHQWLRLRLPSGVEVAAAPGSAVRIAGAPGGGHHDLYISGEAYVDADGEGASGEGPTIHAANAIVRPVRARFTVRTDPTTHEVRIAVAGGTVLLGDSGASWRAARVLTHDGFGAVSPTGMTRTFQATEPDAAMLWESSTAPFGPDRFRDVLNDG